MPTPEGFELQARRIGRLLREAYRIGFVDVGGWDTQVNAGAAHGALAGHIESLGRGLAALAEELGAAQWRNTVVAVVSEFGRTFRAGHGSVIVYSAAASTGDDSPANRRNWSAQTCSRTATFPC